MSKGYHITLKSNLPRIYKRGLTPMIGKRSNDVGEFIPLLCFTNDLRYILEWKRRLYPNISLDDLAIISFDLDGLEYVKRFDDYGDLFTKDTIPSDRLMLVEFIDEFGNKISMNDLQKSLQSSSNQYKFTEHAIEPYEKETTDEDKRMIIEKLASYEHEKWSQFIHSILWTSNNLTDGSKILTKEKIDYILKYADTEYDKTDDIYKRVIRNRVKGTFFIILESPVFDELGISLEELMVILERVEHDRSNRWIKYMLRECNEEYIIAKDKVNYWEREIKTDYSELSESEKESDRKEVYNIFNQISEYRRNNVSAKM